MIRRIVKMTFRKEEVGKFEEFFKRNKPEILKFKGVNEVFLYKDVYKDNILFTISEWDSEQDLNEYRNSSFFADTWRETKALFEDKAEAWSLAIVNDRQ